MHDHSTEQKGWNHLEPTRVKFETADIWKAQPLHTQSFYAELKPEPCGKNQNIHFFFFLPPFWGGRKPHEHTVVRNSFNHANLSWSQSLAHIQAPQLGQFWQFYQQKHTGFGGASSRLLSTSPQTSHPVPQPQEPSVKDQPKNLLDRT